MTFDFDTIIDRRNTGTGDCELPMDFFASKRIY